MSSKSANPHKRFKVINGTDPSQSIQGHALVQNGHALTATDHSDHNSADDILSEDSTENFADRRRGYGLKRFKEHAYKLVVLVSSVFAIDTMILSNDLVFVSR